MIFAGMATLLNEAARFPGSGFASNGLPAQNTAPNTFGVSSASPGAVAYLGAGAIVYDRDSLPR
jgi:hypothetical protein